MIWCRCMHELGERRVAPVLLLIATFALSACSLIPTDALNGYTMAFEKVHDASEDFLVQFDHTQKAAKSFIEQNSEPSQRSFQPYPEALPNSNSKGVEIDKAVETIRLAFEVIAKYNATLVDLAEGKTVETVGSTAKGLIMALSSSVPIVGSIGPAIVAFAQELEKARLRKEFKKALENGEPRVRDILLVIRANVDMSYNNNKVLANDERTLLVRNIVDRVTMLQKLASAYKKAPAKTSFTPVDEWQKELNDLLRPISRETMVVSDFPYPLQFSTDGMDYTADTETQITAIYDGIKKMVKQYRAIIVRVNTLAQSSMAYKEMLNVVLTSLSALEKADKTVPNLAQQATEMLRLAFLIKTHVESIRAADTS